MAKKKDLFTRAAEAPAEALQKTIETTNRVAHVIPTEHVMKGVKRTGNYWHMLGPGLTTGASDDDRSGIATYSQTGAQFGYHFLWMAAWTFPYSARVQEMCAPIGLVSGRGLAGNIRVHFSKHEIGRA